jgi:hypothetical protein
MMYLQRRQVVEDVDVDGAESVVGKLQVLELRVEPGK